MGAHSLKCTCLSWAAKAGVPRESRRMLGYHVAVGDKSMETYSRDSMSAPLRDLTGVLAKMRSGEFLPDSTRSGLLAPAGSFGFATSPKPSPPSSSPCSSTCPSSCSSPTSGCSDDDVAPLEVHGENGSLCLNTATKCYHVLSGSRRLRCGKPFPKAHLIVPELPSGAHCCPRCF